MYYWPSLEYWRLAVGHDTLVEVEIGTMGYAHHGGNRTSMMFGDYLTYLAGSTTIEQGQYEGGIQEGGGLHPNQEDVAYLAQNEIFPQVREDIPLPSFCKDVTYGVGHGKLYHTMLWMGPRHTVSPLHYDPLDNILMQVVGYKRVLLYPPDDVDHHHQAFALQERCDGDVMDKVRQRRAKDDPSRRIPARVSFLITSEQRHKLRTVLGYTSEDIRTLKPMEAHLLLEHSVRRDDPNDYRTMLLSLLTEENERSMRAGGSHNIMEGHDTNPWHYAGTSGYQYNTSAVDIENPNYTLCPNFNKAPVPYECVLGPGEGLYIPKRWWHHVRSLEMSVSANVWWR